MSFRGGTLRIRGAILAKVGVAPYHVSEVHAFAGDESVRSDIPVKILRAVALRDGAESFRGRPITLDHVDVTDMEHLAPKPGQIVGRVHGDARLRDPYLIATVSIWGREALDKIASGELGAFSIGYHWVVQRRGGVFRGQAFDARALNIEGHHVALVGRSRGSDAVRLRLPDHVRQQFRHEQRVHP
jgi:hypothetical protein